MSLKQKFISTATLAIAVGAFGTFVSAQETPATDTLNPNAERMERGGRGYDKGRGMGGGKHGGGDRMMMHSLGKLNLTEAQKTQIKTFFENNRTQNQPQIEEFRGLAMKKRDGIITADEQVRLRELKTQVKASNAQMQNSISAILTPEQRTQLEAIKEEKREQMKERRQNRRNQTNQPLPPNSDN